MILHIVKCEVCLEQFEFNPFERPHERKAPGSWFTLYRSMNLQAQEGWHFCSASCLAQWAEKQVIAAREEATRSSTEVFQGLAERLQQLGELRDLRLPHGNWLPGDEE